LEHDQPVLGLVLCRASQGAPHAGRSQREVVGIAPRQDASADRLHPEAAADREAQFGLNRNLDAERRG